MYAAVITKPDVFPLQMSGLYCLKRKFPAGQYSSHRWNSATPLPLLLVFSSLLPLRVKSDNKKTKEQIHQCLCSVVSKTIWFPCQALWSYKPGEVASTVQDGAHSKMHRAVCAVHVKMHRGKQNLSGNDVLPLYSFMLDVNSK